MFTALVLFYKRGVGLDLSIIFRRLFRFRPLVLFFRREGGLYLLSYSIEEEYCRKGENRWGKQISRALLQKRKRCRPLKRKTYSSFKKKTCGLSIKKKTSQTLLSRLLMLFSEGAAEEEDLVSFSQKNISQAIPRRTSRKLLSEEDLASFFRRKTSQALLKSSSKKKTSQAFLKRRSHKLL